MDRLSASMAGFKANCQLHATTAAAHSKEASTTSLKWKMALHWCVMTVGLRKRTQPQNRRYWGKGVLAQIAEQAVVNGRLYPAEVWHEQFKRDFIGWDELPNGQVIGKSSTKLNTAQFSEFCTQVEAYAATELGVMFYELEAA